MPVAPPFLCAPVNTGRSTAPSLCFCAPSARFPWQVSGDRGEVAASPHQSNAHISKSNRRSRYGDLLSSEDDNDFSSYDAEFQESTSGGLEEWYERLAVSEKPPRAGAKKTRKVGRATLKSARKVVTAEQQKGLRILEEIEVEGSMVQLPARGANKMSSRGEQRDLLPRQRRLSTREWEEQVYQMVRQPKYQDAPILGHMQQTESPHAAPKLGSTAPYLRPRSPRPDSTLPAPQDDGEGSRMEDARFEYLRTELGLEDKWRPLILYLCSVGLMNTDFQRIAQRRKACLQLNVDLVRSRLEFLVSLGIQPELLRKLMVRHPQIIEYRVDEMVKPRIEYLKSLGIPDSSVGKILVLAPSILGSSLKNSLQPRVKFLREVVGIGASDISKVLTRSPQVLTQSIEESIEPQISFFREEMKISKESLAKVVTKHPQLLHYSVEEGIRPRIAFLKSIGMSDQDIAKVLTRMVQVFSLSVDNSLKPKYEYLVQELKCGANTVVSYPAYFTLSLEQRIKPRHKFLITRRKLPDGPFPMKCLAVTDECFCRNWAKSSQDEYHAFRDGLLLRNFAQQFEKKNRVQI